MYIYCSGSWKNIYRSGNNPVICSIWGICIWMEYSRIWFHWFRRNKMHHKILRNMTWHAVTSAGSIVINLMHLICFVFYDRILMTTILLRIIAIDYSDQISLQYNHNLNNCIFVIILDQRRTQIARSRIKNQSDCTKIEAEYRALPKFSMCNSILYTNRTVSKTDVVE